MLAARDVNVDPRVSPGVAEERRHLGRLALVLGAGATLVVAKDDVGPGDVAGVEPEILGSRDGEGQVVVLPRSAADQDGEARGR